MKRLFLASSIDKTAKSIAKEIGGNTKKLKLAFISTAAEPENTPFDWLEKDRNGLIEAGFDLFDYTITDKSSKEIEKDLESVDIVHVNGGNTAYLLMEARKSGFDKWIVKAIRKGKIYTGSSAGSIIAGPTLPKYLITKNERVNLSNNMDCFGFVNLIPVPHWGQSFFKERYLKKRMKQVFREDLPPFILLNDWQYVKVVDDMYRVVDVRDKK